MAVVLPLNITNNCHKPFSSSVVQTQNPNFISLKSKKLYLENQLNFHKRLAIKSTSSDQNNPQQDDDDNNQSLGVKAALSMLKFYKREISPLIPKSCRYVPTCSEYSMEAYKKYGLAKGTILTAWRLCRCNPLGGSGFDPPRWFDEERPTIED